MDRLLTLQRALTGLRDPGQGRPLTLLVDDAHLLDEASCVLIHLIVATKIATPVLTLPSGEMVPDAISALWKEDLVDRIELGPLSREETTELLEAVLRGALEATSEHRLYGALPWGTRCT